MCINMFVHRHRQVQHIVLSYLSFVLALLVSYFQIFIYIFSFDDRYTPFGYTQCDVCKVVAVRHEIQALYPQYLWLSTEDFTGNIHLLPPLASAFYVRETGSYIQ
jgi:hypothetical protein